MLNGSGCRFLLFHSTRGRFLRRTDPVPVRIRWVGRIQVLAPVGCSNVAMKTVFVQLPDSLICKGENSDEGFSRESQFLLALKLFEPGRLNPKEAAAMCGINAVDFLLFAAKAVLPPDPAPASGVAVVTPAGSVPMPPPETGPVRSAVAVEGYGLR